jgi:hypothetical protein
MDMLSPRSGKFGFEYLAPAAVHSELQQEHTTTDEDGFSQMAPSNTTTTTTTTTISNNNNDNDNSNNNNNSTSRRSSPFVRVLVKFQDTTRLAQVRANLNNRTILIECLASRFNLQTIGNSTSLFCVDNNGNTRRLVDDTVVLSQLLVDGGTFELESSLDVAQQQRPAISAAQHEIAFGNEQHEKLASQLMDFVAVPDDQKLPIWSSDHRLLESSGIRIFQQCDLHACNDADMQRRIALEMKQRSYVVVELEHDTWTSLQHTYQQSQRFFAKASQLTDETRDLLSNPRNFQGFHNRQLFNKRFVMMRQWCESLWKLSNLDDNSKASKLRTHQPEQYALAVELQQLLLELRPTLEHTYERFANLAGASMHLLGKHIGLSRAYVDTLLEPIAFAASGSGDDGDDVTLRHSSSNMTLFHYDIPEGHTQQVCIDLDTYRNCYTAT